MLSKYIQDLRWRVLGKREELVLWSHFEAYSICREMRICPLSGLFPARIMCVVEMT